MDDRWASAPRPHCAGFGVTRLRVLLNRLRSEHGTDLDDPALAGAYETLAGAWLRANSVKTVDGAALGAGQPEWADQQ
jgi:hypothetical protein